MATRDGRGYVGKKLGTCQIQCNNYLPLRRKANTREMKTTGSREHAIVGFRSDRGCQSAI